MNNTVPATQLSLTFDLVPDSVRITWKADVIGIRQSRFATPYQGSDLALIGQVLDTLQSGQANFDDKDRKRLVALKLMDSSGRVFSDAHQRVGRALYAALTTDKTGAQALDTVRNYAIAQGQPVSLMLHFPTNAVELAALPWELLWGEESIPMLLSDKLMSSCTRHLNLPQALPPELEHHLPLRLLAISPQINIPDSVRHQERAARMQALQHLIEHSKMVTMAEVSPATRIAVVEAVQRYDPDIVHYYGHGRYRQGQGALLFDALGGGADWISMDRLILLLNKVKLVLLHACQGAMIGEAGLLTGIAPALSSAGVPLVVAMQQNIRISAATRTSGIIYRALAQGHSIQYAVTQARQALYIEEEDQVSWFVPTLYIRSRETSPVHLIGKKNTDVIINKQELRTCITNAFNKEELAILCADIEQALHKNDINISLDLEIVGGESKTAKVLNLIKFLERRGCLNYLIQIVRTSRPGLL